MRVIVFNVDLWIGTARLAKNLRSAGFEVAALCTEQTFLAATRHVDERFVIPDGEPRTVARVFSETMEAWRPDLVVPGDERVLHFLQKVVEADAGGKPLGLPAQAVAVVKRSLPPRKHFQTTQSKHAFLSLANRLGIPVPAFCEVFTVADVLDFAETYGYPVVLKTGFGCAGAGVCVCESETELLCAARKVLDFYYRERSAGSRVTAQRFVKGSISSVAGVADQGRLVAAAASRKTRCYPPVVGPSTVRTFEDVPDVIDDCSRFVEEIAFTGFFGMDYMRDEETGETYLIEFNARPTAQTHVAAEAGVDLCEAFCDICNGRPVKPYKVKEGFVVALYPQEKLRDPDSEFIRKAHHDVPEDDPGLVSAYEDYVSNARKDAENPVRIQAPHEDSRVRSRELAGHRKDAQIAP